MKHLNFTLIIMLLTAFSPCISAQNYLPKERENEIKTSEKYYWGECSDFKETEAKQCAFVDLSNQVIQSAVNQSIKTEQILKTIQMGVHFERLQQQGKIKILAWIEKDSVFVSAQKPNSPMPAPNQAVQPQPVIAPNQNPKPAVTGNPVLQKLAECKTYNDVKRVATMNGLVRGSAINSSKGFDNPEKCIIAVFTSDGTLSALLDAGGSSRTDLLSGKTVQNSEQYYSQGGYYLFYMQQKSEVANAQANVNSSPPQSSLKQDNEQNNSNLSSSNPTQKAPPIININASSWMYNAIIRIPKTWNGKSVLANGCVWIDITNKILQNKYNVHPGQRSPKDGHIYFDENNCESDNCRFEILNGDGRFYEYLLSANVILEVLTDHDVSKKMQKMTAAQFADYYKQQYYSQINEETGEEIGMPANVTYLNGMITRISEVYTP